MGLFTKRKEAKENMKRFDKSIEYIQKAEVMHNGGLPMGEVLCNLYLCKDVFLIKAFTGEEFKMNIDNIMYSYAAYEKETIIEKAALGGLLSGNAGAIVGGMPKSKEKVENTHRYLIIGYKNKNSNDSMLIFKDCTKLSSIKGINNFVNTIKEIKNSHGNNIIEL
ncbi:hypothetical protein [Clostridium sp. UBA6640]|uniref:hypothetical protein n=1 Tax=Clostridium sp. UBA6640 TaxID=1946370 RepID=UPI0025BD14AB|nr:hypothetical protein [Clostridium sp. UBA6640]